MEEKSTSGIGYLLLLAGRNKFLLLLSAIFSVFGSLCSFIPYVMVYRILMFLFEENADSQLAIRYALTAAIALIGKFIFLVISGALSHVGAFNTLYSVRVGISRHIASINLGFFTSHTSGEIKKVIIEDVERLEQFLAHQIPDLTAAFCTPIIMFIYAARGTSVLLITHDMEFVQLAADGVLYMNEGMLLNETGEGEF